ncbi:MAG: ATP-dependent sacrificial sulfur transferase LarE, partial [Butyrivibrio sp.]|nr:ATP-dependent sacrificial sulfur transferase LarE [Butyrivibrio sp.]
AVAFSSGVDSTFLLKVAHDTLGEKCIAITGKSESFPSKERQEAEAFCQREGIKQIEFSSGEIYEESYAANPKNRCYICKHILFSRMLELARENGIENVAEGSNMDDLGDYRPGLQAIKELNILSPLRKVELTKAEIREYSKEMGLPTWSKPSFACLASRFVYGERITADKLKMVEQAELLLADIGLKQYRVRIHDKMARIEVYPDDIELLVKKEIRDRIVTSFKEYGFSYVTLDLQGYRTGSMNETIIQ